MFEPRCTNVVVNERCCEWKARKAPVLPQDGSTGAPDSSQLSGGKREKVKAEQTSPDLGAEGYTRRESFVLSLMCCDSGGYSAAAAAGWNSATQNVFIPKTVCPASSQQPLTPTDPVTISSLIRTLGKTLGAKQGRAFWNSRLVTVKAAVFNGPRIYNPSQDLLNFKIFTTLRSRYYKMLQKKSLLEPLFLLCWTFNQAREKRYYCPLWHHRGHCSRTVRLGALSLM